MTQSAGPETDSILQQILFAIAQNPDPEQAVPAILQAAQLLTGAQAAGFLLFTEPHIHITKQLAESTLPDEDSIRTQVTALTTDLHTGADLPASLAPDYPCWSLLPIRTPDGVVGAFYLLYNSAQEPSPEVQSVLRGVLAGLVIITISARTRAHHKKLSRNQNEFIRIVSHDMRSPLTSIQGFASMLESNMVGELNERQAYFVHKILSGIDQMVALVDNIQDAGRFDPETGFYEMERAPCDLSEIVQRIVSNHPTPADKPELLITVSIDDSLPIVNVDARMLERAITNLIDNAFKYTPNGGKIVVGIRREDEQIIISVADSGFGISADNQPNLFQRHFRIRRREHKQIKGSGLGLFIVRSVAQRHGGAAWVESAEGQGSTFFISLPLKGNNLLGDQPEGGE